MSYITSDIKTGSIEQLRNLTPLELKQYDLFYCIEDGKEGNFKVDLTDTTSLDDGLNVIVATTVRLKRLGVVQKVGKSNILLGNSNTGSSITTGTQNVYLGGANGTGRESLSNQIVLSDGIGNVRAINNAGNWLIGKTVDAGYQFDVAGTLRNEMSAYFATTSGNVGIGTTSPLQKLDVRGNAYVGGNLYFPNGTVYHDGAMHVSAGSGGLILDGNGIAIRASPNGAAGVILYGNTDGRIEVIGTGSNYFAGSVAIGTATNVSSSICTLSSTTKGFLPPRLTTTQINAIVSPVNGLYVHNIDLNTPCFYDGTGWRKMSHSSM